MGRLKDLTGMQIGYWNVIDRDVDYVAEDGKKSVRWKCKCKCGNVESVVAHKLIIGASRKCNDCV